MESKVISLDERRHSADDALWATRYRDFDNEAVEALAEVAVFPTKRTTWPDRVLIAVADAARGLSNLLSDLSLSLDDLAIRIEEMH